MRFDTCRKCNRVFQYTGGDILCPDCTKNNDGGLGTVREYLAMHPGVSATRAEEDTGVPASIIRQWLKSEKIVVSNARGIGLKCEKCGKVINSGRICHDCKNSYADYTKSKTIVYKDGVGKVVDSALESMGMHFIDRKKR